RSEDLRGVANRGYRLIGAEEVLHSLDYLRVHPEIFRRPASWYDKRVIRRRVDLVEGCIQGEVVTALFAVGLLALEIMDRCRNLPACLFVRTDGVNGVSNRKQGLEWEHR